MNRGMQTIDVERSPCILDHRTKRKVQIWTDTEESPLEAATACQSTLWLNQQHKKKLPYVDQQKEEIRMPNRKLTMQSDILGD